MVLKILRNYEERYKFLTRELIFNLREAFEVVTTCRSFGIQFTTSLQQRQENESDAKPSHSKRCRALYE